MVEGDQAGVPDANATVGDVKEPEKKKREPIRWGDGDELVLPPVATEGVITNGENARALLADIGALLTRLEKGDGLQALLSDAEPLLERLHDDSRTDVDTAIIDPNTVDPETNPFVAALATQQSKQTPGNS